jgi:hypothetical protein
MHRLYLHALLTFMLRMTILYFVVRPFHMTPYAIQHAPFGHQPDRPPLVLVPQPPPQSNIILSDVRRFPHSLLTYI